MYEKKGKELKSMSKKKPKKETVEEFLARGGEVTVIPPEVEDLEEGVIIRPTGSRSPTLYSLDEAQHFFGKKKVTKKKEKKADFSKIDKSKLPEALHHLFPGAKSE